jgi:esterase/lipase superfamily enzyme
VVQALSTSSLPPGSLKQLIFVATDVDSGVFQQAAKALNGICSRVTLYTSDRDKALKTSKTKMCAGEAGAGLVIVSGADTVVPF